MSDGVSPIISGITTTAIMCHNPEASWRDQRKVWVNSPYLHPKTSGWYVMQQPYGAVRLSMGVNVMWGGRAHIVKMREQKFINSTT